jgi:hypothetical protein
LTILAGHLSCDAFNKWCHCEDHIWAPNKHKKVEHLLIYFRCESCDLDILCERGLGIKYVEKDGKPEKVFFCRPCQLRALVQHIWPPEVEKETLEKNPDLLETHEFEKNTDFY